MHLKRNKKISLIFIFAAVIRERGYVHLAIDICYHDIGQIYLGKGKTEKGRTHKVELIMSRVNFSGSGAHELNKDYRN